MKYRITILKVPYLHGGKLVFRTYAPTGWCMTDAYTIEEAMWVIEQHAKYGIWR